MKIRYTVLGMTMLLGTIVGCQSPQQKNDSTSENVNLEEALNHRPFVNDDKAAKFRFFLNIVDQEQTDSTVIYTAKSIYHKDTVGLKIEVLNKIAAGVTASGQPDQDNGFVPGAIRFSSIGVESDHFVQALQDLFGVHGAGKMTNAVVSPLVFSSNNEAIDLTKDKPSTYSFKLFIANEVGAEAEVFAVLDTYRKSFEISEKDDSYRAQLISAFAQN